MEFTAVKTKTKKYGKWWYRTLARRRRRIAQLNLVKKQETKEEGHVSHTTNKTI
jgi:hypothetical protein